MLTSNTLCTAGDLSFSLFADMIIQDIFAAIVFGIILKVSWGIRKKLHEGFEVTKRLFVIAFLVILGTLKVISPIAVIVGFLCICAVDYIDNMKQLLIVIVAVVIGGVISVMYNNYPFVTEKSPL